MFFDKAARLAFGLSGGGGGLAQPNGAAVSAPPRRPRLGLALSGGAARGWAHIGVLQALQEHGIEADIVAGTSIGALVGGCHIAGKLSGVEDFARSLTRRRVISLLDVHFGGAGLIGGEKLRRRLEHDLGDITIESLPKRFAAISTEIGAGHEVWLTHGRLVDAIRASYALPGIFDPVKIGNRWLMDGALVNPLPISTARSLGAEIVVGINVAGDGFGRGAVIPSHGTPPDEPAPAPHPPPETERGLFAPMRDVASRMNPFARREPAKHIDGPRMATVMIEAFNVTQDRIARARLAGDPPDIMIAPAVGKIGLFEFHRANEAIEAGREAGQKAVPRIVELLDVMQEKAA